MIDLPIALFVICNVYFCCPQDVPVYSISRWYINVCNSDVFGVANVYIDCLKFCIVCINGCCCLPRPGPSSSQSRFLLSR